MVSQNLPIVNARDANARDANVEVVNPRVVNQNIQDANGRILVLGSNLAIQAATRYTNLQLQRLRDNGQIAQEQRPNWREFLEEMLTDAFVTEFGRHPEMGEDYSLLAFRCTSAGLMALELGHNINDATRDYLAIRGGGRLEAWDDGPYIIFRDYLRMVRGLLPERLVQGV